jgi:O-antigen/teichoic acid export membrane protein
MVKPSVAFFTLQIGFTLVQGIDNLVIGYALGGAAVTRYAVPFRLMWMGRGMFSVAVAALTPTVTMSYARNRGELLARGFLLSMRVALLYAMAGVLMLVCAGPVLIRLWAGDGVMPDTTTYALQVAFFVLAVWNAAPSMILWATTRHYVWAGVTIFEGLLNLALSLWWVRYWGLAGVIGATVFTSIVTNTWYLPYGALRTLGLSPARLMREIAPGALIASVAVALVLTLWRDLQFGTAPALIGAALTLTAICSTIYAWLVFSRSERAAFARWLGQSLARAA